MDNSISLQRRFSIVGVPVLIAALMTLIAKTSMFDTNPSSLSIGITFDLLLTVPLIYFLLIRRTSIPKTTVVPVLVICMLVCSLILPSENQYYLNLFKVWILPLVELSVISFVIYNIVKAIKHYKLNISEAFDFFTTLKNTCYGILPKAFVIPVVTEIAVFYYGFIYWRQKRLKQNEFTYHKESGTIALLAAIIFLVIVETFVFHILLVKWSETIAWILTFLSIYSGIQLFGFLKSMLKRPISIENNTLYIRYGIMTETAIRLKDIRSIEVTSKEIEFDKETRRLSFLGDLEGHNVLIHLKNENELTGLYGMKKNYKNLALHVDEKVEFRNRINNAIQQLK